MSDVNVDELVQEPDQAASENLEKEQPEEPGQEQVEQSKQEPVQETQQGNPNWWKPDLFKLKYRGKEVTPRDYNHAVQLMQQGWSYSQAMAEVNRQKQELEGLRSRYNQYEQLDRALQTNPAFAEKIWQMYQQAQQGQLGGQQGQPLDPQYQQLYQQFASVQEKLKKWEESQADSEVEREISDLRAKLPSVPWDTISESGHTLLWDVINHAYQNRFPTLMAAARDYLWDSMQSTAQMHGAQQVAAARQKQAKAGVVASGQSKPAAAPSGKSVKDLNYDDLANQAIAEVLGKK